MTGWTGTTLRERCFFYAGAAFGIAAASLAWLAGIRAVAG